jgi:adenine-specific DNA-methyltransferase
LASLVKTYSSEKQLGQIYTPDFIVCKILDQVGYLGEQLLGKTILDPACGDGRFLVQIAKRILQYSPIETLAQNLEKIHGWDVDEEAIEQCIGNLNQLIQNLGILVNWQVKVCNSLEMLPDDAPNTPKFDFVVGNPPYIRIQHLEKEQRTYIQTHYHFCKSGSTDIYIAFFELSQQLLSPNGVVGFITPNTWFYTQTGKALRQYFAQYLHLISVTNYADIQVFDNATTYSAITVFDTQQHAHFTYQKAINLDVFEEIQLPAHHLKNKVWQLDTKANTSAPNTQKGARLGDIARIHVGITTLCDKAYLFEVVENLGDDVLAQNNLGDKVVLEKGILKPIIKASVLKSSDDVITQHILFPYERVGEKHRIIDETRLQTHFAKAYAYLQSVKELLDKRDNGKPNLVAWYAFGRSQGLDTSFGKKILFSPMNKYPKFVLYENEDCTFYSGYCLKYEGDYDRLLTQLNSDRMQAFISVSSRDFRGGWKAYNKKIVEEFWIEEVE